MWKNLKEAARRRRKITNNLEEIRVLEVLNTLDTSLITSTIYIAHSKGESDLVEDLKQLALKVYTDNVDKITSLREEIKSLRK